MSTHAGARQPPRTAPNRVVTMREDLLAACRTAGQQPQNVFTLSAPTGSGKTVAMLAFALEHAAKHGLRRIVLVIPYLSIIEQTAGIYHGIFESEFGPHYVLEHHSLAHGPTEDRDEDEDRQRETARLMAENWDAPIVITTSVQFFESLFSNRPSACRKLHRLARSVVLFDEVQTFPTVLAIPTLATLAHMAARHRCTTVFATATQPAFTHFDKQVKKIGGPGWQPPEIVPPDLRLFERAKRTTVHWPHSEEKATWDEMTQRLASHERVLCIVNLKRHALELLQQLQASGREEGLFHLSTNMCPAHREVVLAKVHSRLRDESAGPCRLIATQCVEAGVDIDFPVVYRAMGPLEAIAQAAGRCNRNGRLTTGDVHVFVPDPGDGKKTLYPSCEYQQAAMRTQTMLNGERPLDLNLPDTFDRYYRGLYELRDLKNTEILDAVKAIDFEEVAKLYHLIDGRAVNLVVPYKSRLFRTLFEEAQQRGLSGDWIRRARPLTVSVYRTTDELRDFALPVPLPDWAMRRGGGTGACSDEWFLLPETMAESYDSELLGLTKLPGSCAWIA